MASIMLVQTEDLLRLIAPIVWLKFGAVIALRYRTQPLTEAANTPTLSVLHFVKSDYAQLQPTYHVVARNFPIYSLLWPTPSLRTESKWNTIS